MSRDVNWNVDEIRLKDYDLSQLPDSPICPVLVKLFLQLPGLTTIPPTFFDHMPVLEVLDLSNTNIESLPTSISSLSLLKELFLRDCPALMELPTHIGMLSKLKLFDMQGTEIMLIPKEMGKLKDLEVLRISLSQYAKDYIKTMNVNKTVIPRKMISELKKLKELCLSVPPEAEWWEEEVKDIQNELCDLENLQTLRWYLPTDEVLHQFLLLEKNHSPMYANLSNFLLTVGQHAQLTSCLPCGLEKKFEEFKKCLKWINAEGSMDDIYNIMASTEALFLSRHWTIENLSTFNVSKLKHCLLAECNEMESLVEADGLPEDVELRIKNGGKFGFELLQYLSIHHMNKLQSIWKGPIGKDSLSKLTILALHTCTQLTSVFTPTIAQNLSCLIELIVEDCPKVTSLVSEESHYINCNLIFPSLERIFLLDLPELVNLFGGQIMLEKLRTLLIYNCQKLRLSITELPHIKKIEGENEWWNEMDFDKSQWENIFMPLKNKRDLVEQLFQATNSLEHLHDILSHEYDEKKSSDLIDIREQVIRVDTSMEKGEGIFLPPEGYLHKGAGHMPFDIHPLPSYIGQAQSQHLDKFYGHPGLSIQPLFAESFQRSTPAEDPIQKQKLLGNMGHGSLNPRRTDTASPYYISPTNMGILQFPNTPYASPPVRGSPIGGVGFQRTGMRSYGGNQVFKDPKTYSFLEELKSGKGLRLELSDIFGHIVEFCGDQHGSRFIQQKLEICSIEEKESVFKEVLPNASSLITDVFGNYVIQKFFEYGSGEQRRELAKQLEGQILHLSLHIYGCRVIQKALDVIEVEQKIKLVRELDGHVLRCVRDQNGNHVIQKCIGSIPMERIKFVILSFSGQVAALSTHPYGCRVIQRVLEHSTDELQSQFIVDEILESVYTLAQDQYGNYVTQHVLERGKPEERNLIAQKLAGHVVQLSQHKFASNVIEKCLEYADSTARGILIDEIIGLGDNSDNLLAMVKDQFANYVIQKVLRTCSGDQREVLLGRIKIHLNSLKKYTYGKHIVARFEQLYGEELQDAGS